MSSKMSRLIFRVPVYESYKSEVLHMMKKLLFLSLPLLLSCAGGFSDSSSHAPERALKKITEKKIRRHVDYLASDALMGRDTPSPGLEQAARYIAGRFQAFGLQPVRESWYAPFALGKIRLGPDNSLRVASAGDTLSFRIKKDFMPFAGTADRGISAGVVFAGYGISAPEHDYDDYAGIDVQGKIVLVFRHEPGEKDPASPFDGRKASDYSQTKYKIQNAIDHGAAGVLIIQDPLHHRRLKARGFPWPSLYKHIPRDAVPLTLVSTSSNKIPAVEISEKVLPVLQLSKSELKKWQQQIDESMTPASRELPGVTVMLRTSTDADIISVNNVAGLLPGSDPVLRDEVVVAGAHYDHVGHQTGVPAEQDSIFNGADDNASGTSLLLALAEAAGSLEQAPKRSILFIAFAAEEKGLLGSRAYVDAPLFPLEKTVAMLNFDMVGRNSPDTVSVCGTTRSPDLIRINEEENRAVGLHLKYDIENLFMRSDQASFARHKIPFLFYSSNLHPDYHKVSDHADKINAEKIARIGRLGFRVLMRIADSSEYYRFTEPGEKKK